MVIIMTEPEKRVRKPGELITHPAQNDDRPGQTQPTGIISPFFVVENVWIMGVLHGQIGLVVAACCSMKKSSLRFLYRALSMLAKSSWVLIGLTR